MNTVFLLMAQYDGRAVIPADVICRDFFAPLTFTVFMRKIGNGDIPLPLVRMEDSQKGARVVHLADLAEYIDSRREAAKKELRAMLC